MFVTSIFVVRCSLFVVQYSSFFILYWLFFPLSTLFVVHCSLFVVHCSLFVVHCSLFIVRCSLFVVQNSLSFLFPLSSSFYPFLKKLLILRKTVRNSILYDINLRCNKIILNTRTQIFVSTTSLLIGGLLYVCYRTQTLVMFNWFSKLNILETINSFRYYTLPQKNKIPNWVLYSLPDGLWIYSYTSCMLIIWRYKIMNNNLLWIFGLPTIALLSEIAQYFNILQGVFDPIDVLCYTLGISLALVIQKSKININFKLKLL